MGKKRRRQRRGDDRAQPYWSPVPRPSFTRAQQASIVVRHLVPLACLALFGGSLLQFLLLTVFNLAFTIAGIATVGAAVSTRQEVRSTGVADQLAALFAMAFICIAVSLALSFLFGWVIAVFAADEADGLWNRTLWWGVFATVLAALPGMWMQYQADLAAKLPEEERKRRDQPVIGVHLFSAMFLALLSPWTLGWGQFGALLMALLVTALFIFRDLRPDLARNLVK